MTSVTRPPLPPRKAPARPPPTPASGVEVSGPTSGIAARIARLQIDQLGLSPIQGAQNKPPPKPPARSVPPPPARPPQRSNHEPPAPALPRRRATEHDQQLAKALARPPPPPPLPTRVASAPTVPLRRLPPMPARLPTPEPEPEPE